MRASWGGGCFLICSFNRILIRRRAYRYFLMFLRLGSRRARRRNSSPNLAGMSPSSSTELVVQPVTELVAQLVAERVAETRRPARRPARRRSSSPSSSTEHVVQLVAGLVAQLVAEARRPSPVAQLPAPSPRPPSSPSQSSLVVVGIIFRSWDRSGGEVWFLPPSIPVSRQGAWASPRAMSSPAASSGQTRRADYTPKGDSVPKIDPSVTWVGCVGGWVCWVGGMGRPWGALEPRPLHFESDAMELFVLFLVLF